MLYQEYNKERGRDSLYPCVTAITQWYSEYMTLFLSAAVVRVHDLLPYHART